MEQLKETILRGFRDEVPATLPIGVYLSRSTEAGLYRLSYMTTMYAALRNEGLDLTKLDPTNSYVRFGSASKLQFDFFPGWGSIN
jgi:hypothetical protein